MRIGRGNSPLELKLPYRFDRPILAVGAHNKVAVALAWEDRVVVSQHLGNLDAPRTINQFERTIEDLQRLYAVEAEIIVCDAHPDYFSSRWARDQKDKELIKVYHHHAHASSLYGEQRLEGTALIFTWDGIGYGEDGTLWGGEALLGRPGNWKRVATFRPFSLPGAIKVAHEPWRSAQSLCWECDREWTGNPRENALLRHAWETGINSPRSSAVGRLFDAAAAFTRTLKQASFDGQAPMWLESISASKGKAISLPQHTRSDGVIEVDWEPTILTLLDESRSSAIRAADFHATMAQSLSDQTQAITEKYDFDSVGITGGVFQNHLLTEAVVRILASQQRPAIIHETIPSNDAGISFGQIIEAINTKH
ncbi:carbamoyltransferase HypF [Candidatus Reidiella endopervernicosa]|nr:carbamoyltransferase HypF [Candidatus Reidiella endopervernicosa]QKQ27281.1 carbamoyltransferase HypF [Candidatus Reidiella endopervernicosa]